MESGLLNTFHDDHCDGTYVKYENDSSLWPDVTDAIGLQLTETLHGILPATAEEDKINYFQNEIEIKNTYRIKHELDQSNYIKNEHHSNNMYKKEEPSIFGNHNANNMRDDYIVTQYIPADDFYDTMSPSVEVISVDPNCEFESPSSENDSDDSDSSSSDSSSSDEEGDAEEKADAEKAKDEQENDSSSSNSDDSDDENSNTSISDYCGSSDEDDSDNDEVFERTNNMQNHIQCQVNEVINFENVNNVNQASVISTDHHKPKKRHHKKSLSLPLSPIHSDFTEALNYTNCSLQGIELNEIASRLEACVDTYHKPLEAEIDEKHFDLATFITQDDDEFRPGVLSNLPPKDLFAPCKPKIEKNIPVKNIKAEVSSDSDSDESIDIETVQDNPAVSQTLDDSEFADANEKFPQVDDDPIRDPSWSPSRVKNSKPSRVNTRSRARVNNTLNKNANPKPVKSTNSSMPQNIRFNKKPQSSLSTAANEKSKVAKPTSNGPVYNINRKKFGLGRGKNISMCSKPAVCDTDESDKEEKKTKPVPKEKAPEKVSAIINSNNIKVEKDTKPPISVFVKQEQKKNDPRINAVKIEKKTGSNKPVELSRIANNIKKDAVVVKQETINASKPSVQPTIKIEKPVLAETKPTINVVQQKIVEIKQEEISLPPPEPVVVPTKKKLNLEEYKRRREILSSGGRMPDNTIINNLDSKANSKPGETAKIDKPLNTQNKVEPIVNNVNTINTNNANKNHPNQPNNVNAKQPSLLLKNYIPVNKPGTKFYDPIIEAKNKVLRMQELKKVARTKLIDVTVSSKVGPVTKILPLEQITSMGKNKDDSEKNDENKKINSEYEEIIIVSASANTDITIPPVFEKLVAANPDSKSSSSLLYNINDTIQKASMCGEAVKISSNSLISSIQDVVLKKSGPDMLLSSNSSPFHKSPNVGVSPPSQFSPEKPEMSKTAECINAVRKAALSSDKPAANSEADAARMEHGEDKIIMHLRKDRIRQKTISVSTQTDFLTQFPALKLLHIDIRSSKTQDSTFHSDKSRRKQKRSYRSRGGSCSSDDADRKPRSRSRLRSISPHDRNRSISPRHNHHVSSDRRSATYQSNKHRTNSPYRKKHKRSTSRSLSRSNASKRRISRSRSRSCSSSYSDRTDKEGRSRSRHRRRYNYSRSPSTESSYTSKSRSRSRSSRSRSRSKSKTRCRRSRSRSRSRSNHHRQERMSSPAVEERRIVYVGRIEKETSKDDLKRKFISYGPIRKITLHYKDTGMKYGFVTFERAQDAFKAIDNALRDPKIDQYDVSFGGRRAFCRASYSDLDNAATNSLQGLTYSSPALARPQEDDSFEALLQKVKKKISATKSTVASPRVKT